MILWPSHPETPPPGEDASQRRIAKLERINAALMAHVERSMDQQGGAYSLFQTATMLEGRVRTRTEELTGLMHRLERSNAALVAAKEEAENGNRSKTRFLAAASHDLLQPLNAARLSAVMPNGGTGSGSRGRLDLRMLVMATGNDCSNATTVTASTVHSPGPGLGALREHCRNSVRPAAPVSTTAPLGIGTGVAGEHAASAARTNRPVRLRASRRSRGRRRRGPPLA